MSIYQHVAERMSIEDACAERDHVVATIGDALRLMEKADETMKTLGTYGLTAEVKPRTSLAQATKEVDRAMWRATFARTGLTRIMDKQATTDFNREIDGNKTPEFTVENIQATFLTMSQSADEMFARGVYNIFRRLDRRNYRTNEREPFKIGNKVIVEWIFEKAWSGGGIRVNYNARETLNDLDRVMTTLVGEHFTAHSLVTAIDDAFTNKGESEYTNQYMRIKGFKNGNAHVWFTDAERMEKVNDLIAEYCGGNALAGDVM